MLVTKLKHYLTKGEEIIDVAFMKSIVQNRIKRVMFECFPRLLLF